MTLGTEHFQAFTSCDECHFWLPQSEVLQFSGGSIVATVKMTYALLALALTFTTGMAVVTVIAYPDQAMVQRVGLLTADRTNRRGGIRGVPWIQTLQHLGVD